MSQDITILCPGCYKENSSSAHFCMHCGMNVILNDDIPSDERRYFITRVIKHGGQGSVYEGVDAEGKVYAIKEMRDKFSDPAERDDATRRFHAEAQILKTLEHPRVPRIYSDFTDEGRHYLTMDFVQGHDLEHIIETEGVIPEEQVLEWAMQICDVLIYLHGKGIIYRDMKPSNVMIDSSDGKIKLVDFGIAKIFKPTERGTQIGTPGYAPPEQYQGLATPVSDIYALAATLHHLLTGRDPTEQPPFVFPPARDITITVSRRTSDVLERALQQNMQDRIQTVSEFRSLLRPTINFSPAQVRVAANTVALQPSSAAAGSIQQHSASTGMHISPDASTIAAHDASTMSVPAPTSGSTQLPPPAAPPPPSQRQHAGQQTGQQQSTSGGFSTVLAYVAVALLVVLGGGVAFYLSTMPASPPPPAAPALQPARQLSLQVEAEVPAGPGNAPPEEQVIREALREAYRTEIEQAYPGAVINPNYPITVIGQPEQLPATGSGSTLRYRATMQGFVALPE